MDFIRPFDTIRITDIALVGGKNASLGEMMQQLTPQGIPIPTGFAITADAYWQFLKYNQFNDKIAALTAPINKEQTEHLQKIGLQIRKLMLSGGLPPEVALQIKDAYKQLERQTIKNCDVAIRSSATAEDLPTASFAGQQETFLNVRGADNVCNAVIHAYASLFTDRAIAYRIDQGFDHMSVGLSVGVQKMVRSDRASSGVMFTLDTESGFRDVIAISSSYGLGENIVQGTVNPDEFYVHKPTLEQGFRPILKKRLGSKALTMVYAKTAQTAPQTKVLKTNAKKRQLFSLSDDEILILARYGLIIEKHYTAHNNGRWTPMDIEWAKDGVEGKLYIVQARPETVHSQNNHTHELITYHLTQPLGNLKPLCMGKSIGSRIASGKVRVVRSRAEMKDVQPGEILVADMTDPDWEPVMKKAAGIVTNRGGRTCHAAIVSRELGIPAVIGTENATQCLRTGELVTIDCSQGTTGFVFAGSLPFECKKILLEQIPKPPIPLMINAGNPDEAFNQAQLPHSGVGLARLEFIINNAIKIHPMALLHPDKVSGAKTRKQITDQIKNYASGRDYFITTLAQEIGTIVAANYPRPVTIRLSDFKSNEYHSLLGGASFEPTEENPMIGFRGASRYYHPRYQEAFLMECQALAMVRSTMGLKNAIIMLPFVRTVQEAQKVLKLMATEGLVQGKDGLKIYMMCEIPANVILIDQFAELFDGFSIGSNDLTQTTLAVDRDSQLVIELFDERNPAVTTLIAQAIEGAHRHHRPIGLCGQAPSDHPTYAQMLIQAGIDSISLNPDVFLSTLIRITAR